MIFEGLQGASGCPAVGSLFAGTREEGGTRWREAMEVPADALEEMGGRDMKAA